MTTYNIYSKSGMDMGTFQGESKEEAFEAMVEEIGGGLDADGGTVEGTVDDYDFEEGE